MYAVVVTFTLKPGMMAAFLPLMQENATKSRETEAGCQQFDVCTDPDRPDEVFLYERYDDRAAFEAHLQTAHFKSFGPKIEDMIAAKDIRTYAQVTA